jgi:hypothetical protein
MVSVQPTNGSLYEEMIIDGRTIVTRTFYLRISITRSAIAFEKVSVLGYMPIRLASFSLTNYGSILRSF